MRFAAVVMLFFGLSGFSRADDGLQPDLVDRLKAATVFVKVGSGELKRTGTGFLFTFDGKNSLIATNQHVIAPFESPDAPPPKVSVIFFSGQSHELTVDAIVAAADKDSDLAVLRFSALQEVPKPLDVSRSVELRETMSVYAAGFPFGSALSQTKGNPSVSISKGSISSLQRNERGELGQIVLECGLHPGNSGSPVVDADGRLVGVAVAKIAGTNVGMAIPPHELTRLLDGRAGRVEMHLVKKSDGVAEIEANVHLIDPLKKIRKVSVRVARNDSFTEFKLDKDGKWKALPGAAVTDLRIDDQVATGTFVVKSNEKVPIFVSVQAVLVKMDDSTVFSRPSDPFRVDFRPSTATNLPTMPFRSKAIEITEKASPEWIFKEVRRSGIIYSDRPFVFSEVPDEMVGGTLLVRKFADGASWLENEAVSAKSDGRVYAIIRTRRLQQEEISEVSLAQLERHGWEEIKGTVETTFPNGEDWRWIALRRNVKKGDIILQLSTSKWEGGQVLFVFKDGK